MPEVERSCAKLRSAAAAPSGTPSNRICAPEAPSSSPASPASSSAARSSFQVVSNCAAVRTWPNSYSRANFSRMLRLRTNWRAAALVSTVMVLPKSVATCRSQCEATIRNAWTQGLLVVSSTLGRAVATDKHCAGPCSVSTNRTVATFAPPCPSHCRGPAGRIQCDWKLARDVPAWVYPFSGSSGRQVSAFTTSCEPQ